MNSQHLKNLRIVYCVGGCGATEYILHSAPILHIAEVEIWMSRIIPPWQTEPEHCINTTEKLLLCCAHILLGSDIISDIRSRCWKVSSSSGCMSCSVECGEYSWRKLVPVRDLEQWMSWCPHSSLPGGWGPCSAAEEETETHLARNWVRSAWSEPGLQDTPAPCTSC